MWDEGAGPLWNEEWGQPESPEWLQRALGLSESLVVDLLTWLSDMTALHLGPTVDDLQQRGQQLDDRGRELAERLQSEVGTRCEVSYPD
jgi:hypothetical protein